MDVVIVENGKLRIEKRSFDGQRQFCSVNPVYAVNRVHSVNAVNSVNKVTKIKGQTLKEYQHQYYLKTVALGWRHY